MRREVSAGAIHWEQTAMQVEAGPITRASLLQARFDVPADSLAPSGAGVRAVTEAVPRTSRILLGLLATLLLLVPAYVLLPLTAGAEEILYQTIATGAL